LLTTGSLPLLARLGIAATSTQLVVLAAAGVVLWATEAALEYQAARVWRAIAGTVQQELRIQGYDAVQNADFSVLDEQRIGGLANILNDDVAQIEVFLKSSANDVVQLMMNVAIVGPLFYYVAPSLLYIAVLPIPFLIWVSFGFIDRSTEPHARTREHAAALNNQLVTNLSGVAVIRSFATEEHELAHIRQLSSDYQTSSSVTDHQAAALSPSIRLIMVSTWASQIVIGGFGVLRGQLLPGSYITLVSLTQKFLWPLIMLGRAVDDYQRAMASATRVFTLIDLPRGGEGAKGSILPPAPAGGASVAFDHVSFAYPGRPPVLDDVSMKILPGGVVAIVGPTGSGKSTVIKLLLRFYDAEAGRILYNGVDIRSLEAGALRRSISLVSQDAFLFAGTIGENIRYGSFDATSEAVSAAARLAEIERFIGSLPDGYDTVIGDNGLKLSGGQRQRLCLARAILKDAPLLILDEATSAVDYETEIAIQRALHTIKATRTMIVIAHRLTTIRNADRIYVLDGGIVEQGTHDELIARGKTYASLWALQSGLPTDEDMEMTH
jgi:ATP-binding cassette subfamily B protein